MSRVIITDHTFPSIELQESILKSAGFELEVAHPHCRSEEDIIERCAGASVLLVQWAPVSRRVLQALPEVKCIVRYGVGVNNFDLQAARDLGVKAANVPNFCIEEVSDHALAMILSLGRRIPQDHHQILAGGWGINPFRPIPSFADMTLGLVSFGRIAQLVARKAQSFRFRIIAYDPLLPDPVFAAQGVERVDFQTLLQASDVISLHCPLIPATEHLINQETIAQMRRGVLLINTSRGPVVHEQDLVEALQSGHIGGAGLDVFEVEPLPAGSPLRQLKNVILTSHAASVSEKAVEQLQIQAAEAARDFLTGQPLLSALT